MLRTVAHVFAIIQVYPSVSHRNEFMCLILFLFFFLYTIEQVRRPESNTRSTLCAVSQLADYIVNMLVCELLLSSKHIKGLFNPQRSSVAAGFMKACRNERLQPHQHTPDKNEGTRTTALWDI